MDKITVYSYVEDEPSKHVLIKLVERHNRSGGRTFSFFEGFPMITHGFDNIKKRCGAFLNMANAGVYTLILTDLDKNKCPALLIRDWFYSGREEIKLLPTQVIFRVAVREVEAWLMADVKGLADFLGIHKTNFCDQPETLDDPKGFLLDVLRKKATKRKIRDMIPTGKAHIGPMYNEMLCKFIDEKWSIDQACIQSPSLRRAVFALERFRGER